MTTTLERLAALREGTPESLRTTRTLLDNLLLSPGDRGEVHTPIFVMSTLIAMVDLEKRLVALETAK